jgi:hypothetical protein
MGPSGPKFELLINGPLMNPAASFAGRVSRSARMVEPAYLVLSVIVDGQREGDW